ncbi:MAG TPA: pitrilysin family protein, partial [Candidatus Aminicenantes bacterium]|nr:pitrilysin family protein [Candidatus Aminicenantes bacterium]
SEIILNPLFSGLRIDRIKDYMSHEARIEDDDAVTAGHKAAMKALWGDAGYGGSNYGDQKALKSIGKKDITDLYRRMFSKKTAVFSIVSDMEEKAVVSELEKYFAGLSPGREENLVASGELRLPDDRNIRVVKDQKQCYVSRVCPLPPLTGRRYALGFILETLLGKGIGSRLWELRFKEKLAYSVNARASQMARGGIFEAYLETDRRKRGMAEIMLRDVMNDLLAKGLTEEELQVAKVMSKTQFLRANETKVSRARSLGAFEITGLGSEFLSGFFNEIDAVSLDEVNGFIRDVLDPGKALWIIVGPEERASESGAGRH